jgi:hypothetical protein
MNGTYFYINIHDTKDPTYIFRLFGSPKMVTVKARESGR